MTRTCEMCRKETPLARGVCMECWPEKWRLDSAFQDGVSAASRGDTKNPFDPEQDYDGWLAFELGQQDAEADIGHEVSD